MRDGEVIAALAFAGLAIAAGARAGAGSGPTDWEAIQRLVPPDAVVSEMRPIALVDGQAKVVAAAYHHERSRKDGAALSRGYLLLAARDAGASAAWRTLWQSAPVEGIGGAVVLGAMRTDRLAGLRGEALLVSWRIPAGTGWRLVVAGYGHRKGARKPDELFRIKEERGRSGAAWAGPRLTWWTPDDPRPIEAPTTGPLAGRPSPVGLYTRKRYRVQLLDWKFRKGKLALVEVRAWRTRKWFLPEEVSRLDPFEERAGEWLATEPVSKTAIAQLALARRKAAARKHSAASEILRRTTADEPFWDEPWVALAKAEDALGRAESAAAAWRQVLQLNDRNADAAMSLGKCEMRLGDLYSAEAALRWSAYVRPADPKPWQLLGEVHEKMGEVYWASQYFRRAMEAAEAGAPKSSGVPASRQAIVESAIQGLERLDLRIRQQRLARGGSEDPDVIRGDAPVDYPPAPGGTQGAGILTGLPPSAATAVAGRIPEATPAGPAAPTPPPDGAPSPATRDAPAEEVSVSVAVPSAWELGREAAPKLAPPAAPDAPAAVTAPAPAPASTPAGESPDPVFVVTPYPAATPRPPGGH